MIDKDPMPESNTAIGLLVNIYLNFYYAV